MRQCDMCKPPSLGYLGLLGDAAMDNRKAGSWFSISIISLGYDFLYPIRFTCAPDTKLSTYNSLGSL
jgi:hypothetical protein